MRRKIKDKLNYFNMSTYSKLIVELKDKLGRLYNSHDDRTVWIAESTFVPLVRGEGKSPVEALQELKKKIDETIG